MELDKPMTIICSSSRMTRSEDHHSHNSSLKLHTAAQNLTDNNVIEVNPMDEKESLDLLRSRRIASQWT
ncbi:hypothetical protein N7463_008616 [Penicillium fimorum]|uniref:Uncharacterized protein n=1 Tax=Penicillium fimorum TaxID=1882269 RepID=A0A9X0C3Z0_9EURO|nr:hypothetical protein N7463_008616 [Penicillium fimorum]